MNLIATETYLLRLTEFENYIFESSGQNIKKVESFLEEHDRVLNFIIENPNIPGIYENTGEKSWPFQNGRYRIFFVIITENIYLLDLVDNKMSNMQIYPFNSIETYLEN
jgi:hypothetical protein